ncbi:Protein CBG25608 [Caenorhabditis briggsae]|nr:Protein CBG25608 [Caenorhabditis briggsae]CAR98572.1 Protein CBG25608 [Caenorhabditis briggsae]
MARPNMSVNQRFQILDLVNEAAIKIDQATQMLDQANIELMKKYIQVNNSQIVHLELSKFFI